MSWRLWFSLVFATAYLVWIWRDHRSYNRIGSLLCLIGTIGICVDLVCDYIKTLPSDAPLRTITGLAANRSSLFFDHSHWDFILIEAGTGRRISCTTVIDGPWADQPVRATYVDDRRFMLSVVRIEILNDEQFPWHVEKGHAGWVGNAEAKKRPPLFVNFLGFVFIVVGAFAPTNKMPCPEQRDGGTSGVPVE
jgi:hypothetical protein